jgi:two-component system, chemotaxis family, chemotaxis protein CheY
MPLDVLIVDDSAAIRKIIQRVLAQTHVDIGEVFEAGDGLEGIKILERQRINLILSDINMPNMDGLQFVRHIRATPQWSEIPVIMVTTEGSQAKVLEAVQAGAKGYVRKPFNAEQIREKIVACVHALGC